MLFRLFTFENKALIIFSLTFLFLLLFWIGIDETIELIRANGGTCVGYKVDISKKEEVYKAADAIRRDAGDVSIQALYTNYFIIMHVEQNLRHLEIRTSQYLQ